MLIEQTRPFKVDRLRIRGRKPKPTVDANYPQRPNAVSSVLQGTLIATDKGDMPVEFLQPDDFVLTKDGEFAPLRGIGSYPVSQWDMVKYAEHRTVIFPKGSIGNDTELRVSGRHRILVNSELSQHLNGSENVLAAARSFVGCNDIHFAENTKTRQYYHVLLDRHQLIKTSNIWSESLYLGDIPKRRPDIETTWILANDFDLAQINHSGTVRKIMHRKATAA